MLRIISMCVATVLLVGCAAQNPGPTTGPMAQCLVCKHNADLACVDVTVTDKTPQYMYNGKAYYFCSDTCRDEFAKNPGKYAP